MQTNINYLVGIKQELTGSVILWRSGEIQFIVHLLCAGLPWWLRWLRICLQCEGPGFNLWVRRTPGKWNGYPLQYSCVENPTERGAWWATVHGVARSWT